jgi:hypothetical protein
MYCTIPEAPPSSPKLSPEAAAAYQELRKHATIIGLLSPPLAKQATIVADIYARALAGERLDDWTAFVAATALLVAQSGRERDLVLGQAGRSARDFFAQIAVENDDLLAPELLLA